MRSGRAVWCLFGGAVLKCETGNLKPEFVPYMERIGPAGRKRLEKGMSRLRRRIRRKTRRALKVENGRAARSWVGEDGAVCRAVRLRELVIPTLLVLIGVAVWVYLGVLAFGRFLR